MHHRLGRGDDATGITLRAVLTAFGYAAVKQLGSSLPRIEVWLDDTGFSRRQEPCGGRVSAPGRTRDGVSDCVPANLMSRVVGRRYWLRDVAYRVQRCARSDVRRSRVMPG